MVASISGASVLWSTGGPDRIRIPGGLSRADTDTDSRPVSETDTDIYESASGCGPVRLAQASITNNIPGLLDTIAASSNLPIDRCGAQIQVRAAAANQTTQCTRPFLV